MESTQDYFLMAMTKEMMGYSNEEIGNQESSDESDTERDEVESVREYEKVRLI